MASLGSEAAGIKLSAIASVGAVNTSTDQCAAVRNGNTDILATLAPSAGTDTTNASNISAGTLGCARLPALTGGVTTAGCAATLANPSASTLGGAQSFASSAHVFLNGLNTSGIFLSAQPACGDLSNAAASCSTDATNAANITSGTLPAARLPTPASSTLGGIFSFASASNNFLTGLDATGALISARPVCGNLSDSGSGCTTNVGTIATVNSPVPIANGGTGQTAAAAAFNALSPMTTGGDIIFGSVGGVGTRLAANATATNQYLKSVSSGNPLWAQVAFSDLSGSLATAQLPTLASAKVWIGNTSNVATAQAISGDITLASSGSVVVVAINGATLGTTTATSGNLLIGSGSQWVTQALSGGATVNSTGVVTLGNPAASTLGGVQSFASASNNFLTGLTTSGVLISARPTCGNLSNSGTSCTVNTGTSGATIPLLNAANTWSQPQTFNSAAPVIFMSQGSAEENLYSYGSSGATLALQIDNGNMQATTLTSAVTITLATPTHPGKTIVILTQDSTGRVYSISGCKWAGGSAITYSTTANKIDVISIMWDGTSFYCMGGAAFS